MANNGPPHGQWTNGPPNGPLGHLMANGPMDHLMANNNFWSPDHLMATKLWKPCLISILLYMIQEV